MKNTKPVLTFETKTIKAAERGQESCVPDLQGERILQNHLEFRLDEEDEIYEGYGRRANAYPYRQYNAYTRELAEKEIRTAVLENRYIKAVFLTEYGGRLWELWDKENGRNLLYTNDVLQFSNLAVRNAWFSGGVEWNIGVIGHHPYTIAPLYVASQETEEGWPVLRMYEYERIRKVVYQMDFWLEEESRFLNCRMRITNESRQVIPMYWWSNIAAPEYEGGRIIVPAKKAFTFADGAVSKVEIPVVDGIDITDYQTIKKSVDYFFDIPKDCPKYIANVDKNGYGLLQMSTGRQRSRKLFSWGNQEASNHWQEFLTNQAGRYIEIQAGLGKTQYGCLPMAPHTAWEWMERYGALQLSPEEMSLSHEERSAKLTCRLLEAGSPGELEELLKKTRPMAKKQARLVAPGSGYGVFYQKGKLTEHLDFAAKEESLALWQRFFETGSLHCPNPMEAPDEFLMDGDNRYFLEENMGINKDNWYAHYQLGLAYYTEGSFDRAKAALQASYELAPNPWALHGLSCILLEQDKKAEAADRIVQGIAMKKREITYLKEGFKILFLCEAYESLCRVWEELDKQEQEIGKIRFYYINALHKLGHQKEAFELLEKDGGLFMEDIREGEDSVAQLWSELYESLSGKKGQVPYRYNFKAY